MVGASHAGSPSPSELHWNERAGALMSTLLHTAAVESLPMPEVLRWIDRHDGTRPLQILAAATGADSTPTDLLAGIVATDSREQSGIWSTASGVLAAYRTEAAMASTAAPAPSWHEFARVRTPCTCARRDGGSANSRRWSWPPWGTCATPPMSVRAMRVRVRMRRRVRRSFSPSTKWRTSPPSPTCRRW